MPHTYRPKNGFTAYAAQRDSMRALSLQIDLCKLAGQVETNSIMKSLPAGLTAANLCLALEAEITYWNSILDPDPYREFFTPDAHLDDIEYECDIDRDTL